MRYTPTELSAAKATIERLERELAEAREYNQQLLARIERGNAQTYAAEAKLAAVARVVEEMQERTDALPDALRRDWPLPGWVTKFRAALAEYEETLNQSDAERVEAAHLEMDRLRARLAEYEETLNQSDAEEYRRLHDENKQLRARLAALEEEIEQRDAWAAKYADKDRVELANRLAALEPLCRAAVEYAAAPSPNRVTDIAFAADDWARSPDGREFARRLAEAPR